MRVWFARCNGETAHNQPGTYLYVEGELPQLSDKKFNFRDDCLNNGFARIGHPATGDLRLNWWRDCGIKVYGSEWLNEDKIRNHELFASIQVGDIILIPTDQRRYQVHLGVAIQPRLGANINPELAYYYFYNIAAGDWFENAHRVDVNWAKTGKNFQTFDVPGIGGTWLRSFGEIKSASQQVKELAKNNGLEF